MNMNANNQTNIFAFEFWQKIATLANQRMNLLRQQRGLVRWVYWHQQLSELQ
jgi:hypothetical protein